MYQRYCSYDGSPIQGKAGPEGLEPSTNCSAGSGEWRGRAPYNTPNWQQFHSWLVSQGKAKRTVKTNVQYAKRFWFVLDTWDISPLSTSLPGSRSKEITIVALANLAKFQGRYERFQELKKRYALKWSTSNSTQYFERFFNEGLTLDIMLTRVKEMVRLLPPVMGKIVKFGCLVGLRASEVLEAVRLLNLGYTQYFNEERQCLEHFRHPQIFLRQTKKAYISYLSTDNYYWIATLGPKIPSLNAITLACRRKGIKMEMHLCRKIFASWLINKSGIDSTTVDMLQGRCPQSVLVRHYQTPESNLSSRILDSLDSLYRAIEQ
jgi:hypothetical protein